MQLPRPPEDRDSAPMAGHPLGLGTAIERQRSRRRVVQNPADTDDNRNRVSSSGDPARGLL